MLTGYVAAYRAHIDAENDSLFPLALKYLGNDDWHAIEADAALLHGVERALHIQKRFVALRDYIHRLEQLNP